MWRDVPDSIDRFPADFVVSLRTGTATAILGGVTAWWLARRYMEQNYPHHSELMGAAAIVGTMDGLMLGVAAFVLTYVLRVWRYERHMRKRSDAALRRELEALEPSFERDASRSDEDRLAS